MSELIVREIVPVGKRAAYGNVDLGVKENISRGTAYATSSRDIGDGRYMHVTILPDTAHNRVQLTQMQAGSRRKDNMWIFVREPGKPMVPLSKDWEMELFGDLSRFQGGAGEEGGRKQLPPGMSEDFHDTAERDDDGSPATVVTTAFDASQPGNRPDTPTAQNKKAGVQVPKGSKPPKGTKAAPTPAPKPGSIPPAPGPVIESLEDFLALPMPKQLEALKEAPLELAQDVATSDDNSLEADVQTAAFQRVTELTNG